MLAEIGYQSVAITVDHGWLDPQSETSAKQLDDIRQFLTEHQMNCVIESGARFLLDSRRKHYPTLLHDEPEAAQRRIEFLKYCIDVAAELGADCVSLWSGARPDNVDHASAFERLTRNLNSVLDYAAQRQVMIGFEPEPGMLVDTMSRFEQLLQQIDSPHLQLTLDIGHLFCMNEVPLPDFIRAWQDHIVNIHLEDMRAGVHEHLMFGDGDIEFGPVLESLLEIDYNGGVHVELSRHSHDGARVARESFEFLKRVLNQTGNSAEREP